MLHYVGFTIQLALLRVFNVKVKKLTFDTNNYHKCMVFYEELEWKLQDYFRCNSLSISMILQALFSFDIPQNNVSNSSRSQTREN